MERLYNQAFEIMESLFVNCTDSLKQSIHTRPEDIRIAAPSEFIDIIVSGHEKYILGYECTTKGNPKYHGIKIIPNYDLSVVIFHKECNKITDGSMLHKVHLYGSKNSKRARVPFTKPS